MSSENFNYPLAPSTEQIRTTKSTTLFEPPIIKSGIPLKHQRDRPLINLLLFLATLGSTMYTGSLYYAGFQSNFTADIPSVSLLKGSWYSLTILAILGTHEFGHYFACRYYNLNASLPYFLPAPFMTGTIGAVIRIREQIPTKKMLFDIGIAGPIAGFIITVPTLFLGIWLSQVSPLPDSEGALLFSLGEPLLFQIAAGIIWGSIPEGYSINLHPMGFAAWLGLLVTSLNLFPIGQLDGGHISHATLGSRSTAVTLASASIVVGLAFFSTSWIVWAILIVLMIAIGGPRHPPTLDNEVPLDQTRYLIAIGAVIIFILCFTPIPIELTDFLDKH